MTKELQNYVWSILPKEFKEEVKKYYHTLHVQYKEYDRLHFDNAKAKVKERIVTLEYFFGKHNLTSDAEGEEMLTVSRKRIQDIYTQCEKIEMDDSPNLSAETVDAASTKMALLSSLFGSKCLPDIETKPAEPKFNLGDIVRFKYCCTTYRIDGFKMSDGVMLYQVGEIWTEESDLEPYTEPEDKKSGFLHGESVENLRIADEETHLRNLSQNIANCDKDFDNILKDSLSKERRLTIAAQMMQGLICAPLIPGVDPNLPAEYLAQAAFRLADALIAEAEKEDCYSSELTDKLNGK